MPEFKRLPYTTAAEVVNAFNSGKKFEVQPRHEGRYPVTRMEIGYQSDIVNVFFGNGRSFAFWAHGSNNLNEHAETDFLYQLDEPSALPSYVPLPFKSPKELTTAWKAEPHRLKFVIGPDAEDTPGVYDVLSCTQSDLSFDRVKITISGGEASDARVPRHMPCGGRIPSDQAVWLIWLNSASKPERDASAAKAPRAIDLVRDSDKPGITAAKALPPETAPTPAPTFAPPKTAAVAGLLVIHNPDKRSF